MNLISITPSKKKCPFNLKALRKYKYKHQNDKIREMENRLMVGRGMQIPRVSIKKFFYDNETVLYVDCGNFF